jgi:hypothetical protein
MQKGTRKHCHTYIFLETIQRLGFKWICDYAGRRQMSSDKICCNPYEGRTKALVSIVTHKILLENFQRLGLQHIWNYIKRRQKWSSSISHDTCGDHTKWTFSIPACMHPRVLSELFYARVQAHTPLRSEQAHVKCYLVAHKHGPFCHLGHLRRWGMWWSISFLQ